jgi:hypothetical protein
VRDGRRCTRCGYRGKTPVPRRHAILPTLIEIARCCRFVARPEYYMGLSDCASQQHLRFSHENSGRRSSPMVVVRPGPTSAASWLRGLSSFRPLNAEPLSSPVVGWCARNRHDRKPLGASDCAPRVIYCLFVALASRGAANQLGRGKVSGTTYGDYERKLDELDRLLNDPDVPMQPAVVWRLLDEVMRAERHHSPTDGDLEQVRTARQRSD